ncbi:MAG TPA: tRNA uracil 4-sulfurtransferase ThiI [Actinomycetota bacterium]
MARLMLKTAGEIGVKSPRTRRRFLRVLRRNVRRSLDRAGVQASVQAGWGRIMVRTSDPEAATEVLSRVFGLHSVSLVETVTFDGLDDLVAKAAERSRDRIRGRTFAIRPRRSGEHDFRSHDVAVKLGAALLEDSAGVNLDEPEVEVPVEIVNDDAHLVLEATKGAGGLPLGTGGRALAMFSGGFDSPVATWMTMSRGTSVELVVFDLGGCAQTDGALTVAKALVDRWARGLEPVAHIVELLPVVAALTQRVEGRLRQLVLKRAMYRAATILADERQVDAVVTGESIGQASTQTLRNLSVVERATTYPVLRPLVGMSKEEIMGRAREIGTHEASARVHEYCSIATGPVETAARFEEVADADGEIDESVLRAAVEKRRVVELATWTPGPLPEYVLEQAPDGVIVIDVREEGEGPVVGDRRLPFSRLHEWLPQLDPKEPYLFVCSVGSRSELVAEQLWGKGYRAYCLAGGAHRLRR